MGSRGRRRRRRRTLPRTGLDVFRRSKSGSPDRVVGEESLRKARVGRLTGSGVQGSTQGLSGVSREITYRGHGGSTDTSVAGERSPTHPGTHESRMTMGSRTLCGPWSTRESLRVVILLPYKERSEKKRHRRQPSRQRSTLMCRCRESLRCTTLCTQQGDGRDG